MTVLYNEIDPKAAAWLRVLIEMKMIPNGVVDETSIADLDPDYVAGFTSFHTFAGIGVWPYALRLAGWPDDRPVWTGSCPCQPFSSAGQQQGTSDDRHLWPAWYKLIDTLRPGHLFGEQVSSAAAIGKVGRKAQDEPLGRDQWAWVDHVQDDLEGSRYAFGAVAFPGCSIGAPHIRQRLYFAAERLDDTTGARCDATRVGSESQARDEARVRVPSHGCWQDIEWLQCADGKQRPTKPGLFPLVDGSAFRMDSGSPFAGRSRVKMLRGAGNAIVPQVAAAFIKAAM